MDLPILPVYLTFGNAHYMIDKYSRISLYFNEAELDKKWASEYLIMRGNEDLS